MATKEQSGEVRIEKIVREDAEVHDYPQGAKVAIPVDQAKDLEASGHCVPIGGWVDEKDMGETKTDNEVGLGYGPLAADQRESDVLASADSDGNLTTVATQPGQQADAQGGDTSDSTQSSGKGQSKK